MTFGLHGGKWDPFPPPGRFALGTRWGWGIDLFCVEMHLEMRDGAWKQLPGQVSLPHLPGHGTLIEDPGPLHQAQKSNAYLKDGLPGWVDRVFLCLFPTQDALFPSRPGWVQIGKDSKVLARKNLLLSRPGCGWLAGKDRRAAMMEGYPSHDLGWVWVPSPWRCWNLCHMHEMYPPLGPAHELRHVLLRWTVGHASGDLDILRPLSRLGVP